MLGHNGGPVLSDIWQPSDDKGSVYKKFLWNNDSATKYVRLTDSIKYTEIVYERYSASLQLREQLT